MSKRGSLGREVIAQAVRPLVESLEQRQLLSASIEQGVWNIQVDGALASSDNRVVIATRTNNPSILQCGVNGKIYARVRAEQIKGLCLTLGAGDDQVTLRLGKHARRLRADVLAGAGDDVIIGGAEVGRFFGQAGNDTLVGGGGKDRLVGGKGRNALASGAMSPFRILRPEPVVIGTDPEIRDADDVIPPAPQPPDRIIGGPASSARFEQWRPGNNQQPVNGYVPVSDAAQLKNWLIEQAVEQAEQRLGTSTQRTWNDFAEGPGPYYYPWHWYPNHGLFLSETRVLSTDEASATTASLDHSTTNLQEQGVDEADLTKTDGEYLYLISGGKLVIVDALPADQTRIVSTTDLAGSSVGLYLDGDRLIVVSHVREPLPGAAAPADIAIASYPSNASHVRVVTYDITDRSTPTIVETTSVEGYLCNSRMIDGRLYLVLNSQMRLPTPELIKTGEAVLVREFAETRYTQEQYDAVMTLPEDQRHGSNLPELVNVTRRWWSEPSRYETEQEFRERLNALPIEDLLARYATTAAGPDGQVTEFGGSAISSVFLPAGTDRWNGASSSILLLNPDDGSPGVDAATTVVGVGGQVYASADNIYLFSSEWLAGEYRTNLHKFSLGETSITLEASGVVPGTVLNSFAVDEEGDQLRIATGNGLSNNIFVMEQDGGSLEIIGGITGLALTERIYSARFVGDRAYLVTFRQIDPLFVIDLSDPRDPKVAGELKVPGYSSYLHPISDTLLLAVGRDATPEGQVKGVQVSLFDVSDPACPTRIDAYTIETAPQSSWGWNQSEAENDHHAFSYFPESGTLALPVRQWHSFSQDTSEVVVLKIDPEEGISELGVVDHGVGGSGQRNIRIGEDLYSISGSSMKVVKLMSPDEELASVTLPAPAYSGIRWGRPIFMPILIDVSRPVVTFN